MTAGDKALARVIAEKPDPQGPITYALLEAFQRGYPIENLRPLLRSRNQRLVEIAAYLADELGSRLAIFVAEISRLLSNPSMRVRFNALAAVWSSATSRDGNVLAKAVRLLEDPELGVRWQAARLMARVGIGELQAALSGLKRRKARDPFRVGLERVLKACAGDYADILAMIDSADRLTRLFGASAAGRVMHRDRTLVKYALSSPDPEVVGLAKYLLKCPPDPGCVENMT
jgi:hypothetical protein